MIRRVVIGLVLILAGGLSVGAQAIDMGALEGQTWTLDTYRNAAGESVAVLPGTAITAEFRDGQVGGSAGCNTYFGSYTVDGSTIQVSEMGSTLMACASDEQMQQETAYLAALGAAASYRMVEDRLELMDGDDAVILQFSLLESMPLAGTTWVVTAYNNGRGGLVSVLADTEITALFDESGQMAGSAGCNTYSAAFEVREDTLTIGPAVRTLMACGEPQGVMEQEDAYLTALEQVAAYTIRGDRLELKDSEGVVMVNFQAKAEIVGLEWQWHSASTPDGAATGIPNPENYTLLLNADGTLNLRADCNRGRGSYEISGSQIRIEVGALTRALCPPGSLANDYLSHLGAVSSFEVVDGTLVLSPGSNGEILYFVAG